MPSAHRPAPRDLADDSPLLADVVALLDAVDAEADALEAIIVRHALR
jgi:hypothetical protein